MTGAPASAQARGGLAGGCRRTRGRKTAVSRGLLRGAYAARYRRRPRWEEAPMQGPELRRRPRVSRSPGASRTDPERIARALASTTAEVGLAEMASSGPAALLPTGDVALGGGATAADVPTATARDDPERQERWSQWMAD